MRRDPKSLPEWASPQHRCLLSSAWQTSAASLALHGTALTCFRKMHLNSLLDYLLGETKRPLRGGCRQHALKCQVGR